MTKNKYLFPFIALTSLFFLWGFLTVLVDFLIPRLKEIFTLTYFQAGLVQFAFFMAYFLLSIPAGFILSKIGYKKGIVLGLLTMALGCFLFYPAAEFRTFSIFLMAYFILAGGMTILQVAANPFVAVLGDKKGASSRLNLAQAFNSLGTAIAPAIGAAFLLSDTIKTTAEIDILSEIEKSAYYISEAVAVQTPFILLSVCIVALAVIFAFVKLPSIIKTVSNSGYTEVLKNKVLMMGAFAILVYVGAEVAIGSYLVNYFIDMDIHLVIQSTPWMNNIALNILNTDLASLDKRAIVGAFVTFYWSGAMVGRFVGAYLTSKNNPSKVLGVFAIGALLLIVISMNTVGLISMWSILAVGLFNSIMFPTIFTLSIQDIEELKPQASGILCTMIVGGAFIPPLYGFITDLSGFKTAMILLLACYGYIYYFAKSTSKNLS
ncbi:MAG: sugar MFS transporter [Flavobacteriales bacterium]|jgi:FHS family L-fucose permease-like MFS transporter|nr:sugar MFS transporter [Flavobacteriales bacterium]HJN64377.1 sugar MFS transporter [Flavobacteriales bacterium]|tara:strand:+ start:1526 stop:2827 length:1302 start_codon:yes stop_codon:yes gene_type:complete